MVTIKDVAGAAGVSIATVSRALADPDRVAAATRDRVLAVADALGYTPNRAARGLRAGRTNAIGLLVPDLTNPYFAVVARGVSQRARSHGVAVFVADSEEDPAAEVDLLRGLVGQTDGVLLCSPRALIRDTDVLGAHPAVFVNHALDAAPSVALDDVAGAVAALEHLRSLGHRSIAYVAGPTTSWSDARRRDALQAVAERHPELEVHVLGPYPPTVEGGSAAAGVVIASGATAALAFNDTVAVGLMRRVIALGLRVPHDLSVAGFDDTYLTTLVTPALTSVHGDVTEVGRRATDLLLDRIERPDAPGELVLLPSWLVQRDSTAPPLSRLVPAPTTSPAPAEPTPGAP